jgi:hypothetical protein
MPINVHRTISQTLSRTLHALPLHMLFHYATYAGILAACGALIVSIYIIHYLRQHP